MADADRDPDDREDPIIKFTADETRDTPEPERFDMGFEDGEIEPFSYDEDELNLVQKFETHPIGLSYLEEISSTVIRRFDDAWDGTEPYREMNASNWLIFAGELPAKEPPYENSSNPNVPMMLENITRLVTRSRMELFGDWRNVFGVQPISMADRPVAEILSRHGNWQIRNQILDFRRQIGSRGMLVYYTAGDVTCHSYFSFDWTQNRHEILTSDEFVAPYVHVTTMPDYSDLPYYFKIMHRYRYQLENQRGRWANVDDVLDKMPPAWESDPESRLREAISEVNGIVQPVEVADAPYKLLHYEGWSRLPKQDRERFIKIIIDYQSKTLLHLSIHEEDDWQDKQRFESQMQELGMYREDQQTWTQIPMAMQQQNELLSAIEVGQAENLPPEQMAQLESTLMEMQANPLPDQPPIPPAWMNNPDDPQEQPKKPKKVPIRMFSHAVCIEPLLGNLGISPGRIQADLNRAANVALSQYTDSASLGNNWSLITTDNVQFDQPFAIAPGRINKASGVSNQDLAQGIKELRPGPANDQLVKILEYAYSWGQSSIQSPEVMSGAPGKSGETYRGIASRIEQATRQVAGTTQVYGDFVEQVLKNNAKLNAVYLPEEELILITDDLAKGPQELQVRRDMYERDYRVEISSDLRFATQSQRVSEADEIVQMPNLYPEMAQPGMALAFKHEAMKRALEARNLYDMVELLGPAPPIPDTPFGLPPPPPPGAMPPPGEGVPPEGGNGSENP
jgi:hypothetical protein